MPDASAPPAASIEPGDFYAEVLRRELRADRLRHGMSVAAAAVALPLLRALTVVFPRVANNFAVLIRKPSVPGELFPWLEAGEEGARVDREWMQARYEKRGDGRKPNS